MPHEHEYDPTLQSPAERRSLLSQGVLRLRSLFLPSEGLHIGENRVIVKKDSAGAQQLYFQRQDGTEEAITLAASEVKSVLYITVDDSTTRATILTPTSGKKIRIVSVMISTSNTTVHLGEMYFGTGAAITTNAGKEVSFSVMDADPAQWVSMAWPNGGPVAAADEVLSYRTSTNITVDTRMVVHYREE